jgi:hypothetical protein
MGVQAQAGQHGGDHHATSKDGKEHQRAPEPLDVARPRRPGQVPHLLHCEQPSLRQARRSPGQHDQADDQANDAGAAQLRHAARELIADDRDLVSDGIKDLMAECRIVGCHQAEQGHQDQQQREQRNESSVGKVSNQHPAVIVPVLLDQPDSKRRRLVPLLHSVNPANRLSIGFIDHTTCPASADD